MSAILKQKLIDIANGFTKYGLWKGGGSGGSSSLSEMTDVTFTNLQTNDVLKYNGSFWVNDDNLHEYSTEEKVVGKWIDGNSVYEKVININSFIMNSNSWQILPNFPTNVKQVINITALESNDGICWTISVQSNGYAIQFRNTSIELNKYIIQYTKTTD